jgi:hypothetical protein
VIAEQHGQNNGKGYMRGSLYCAAHDETVSTRLRSGSIEMTCSLGWAGKNGVGQFELRGNQSWRNPVLQEEVAYVILFG